MHTRDEKELTTDPKQHRKAESSSRLSGPERRSSRDGTSALRIATGERDLESLFVVICGWVVPLLVKEFLAEYQATGANPEVDTRTRTIEPLGKVGADLNRIR
jgi:hypothetical protein